MKLAVQFYIGLTLCIGVSASSRADSAETRIKASPVVAYRGDSGHTGAFSETVTLPLSLLWHHTVEAYSNNSASPVFSGKTVFFASGATFYAVNDRDGKFQWQFKTPGNTQAAFDTTAALDGDFLYVTDSNSELYKLDAKTGKPIWMQKFSGALRSAPVVNGGVVYFGSGNNQCYAVSADTGQTVWTAETQGAITTSPTVTGGLVVFASSDGSLYSFSAATGRAAWTKALPADPSLYPPVFDGSLLYVSAGDTVYALDAGSGARQFQVQLPTLTSAAPTVGPDALYLVTQDNSVYALTGSGHKRWKTALPGSLTAPPILMGSVLLVPTQHGVLNAYDSDTGALKWQYVVQAVGNDRQPEYTYTNVASAPIYADHSLFVVSDDGTLTAFRSDAVDGVAPQIGTLTPEEGSTSSGDNESFGATVADIGSGIDPKTAALEIDGTADPTAVYRPGDNTFFSGKKSLPDGPHTFSIQIADWRGNKATHTWSFIIGPDLLPTEPGGAMPGGGMPPGQGAPPGQNPLQPPPPPPITSF